jgi:hypothetical protein
VPVCLAVAAVALTLFVVWERHRERVQRDALLDLHLFSLRTFSWGNVTAAMVAVGEFAIIFVLPLYLTAALGLSIMQTGLVLAAMAFGAFASGAAARHLAARFGSPGTVLIGLALEVVGILILAAIVAATTPGWLIALPLVVYGLGLGLASAQLTGTVLRDVPVEISGQGSATQSTVRQIGTALGTAFAGAALSVSLALTLPGALTDAGITGPAASQLADATRTSAGTLISQLRARAPPACSEHRRMPPCRPFRQGSPTRPAGHCCSHRCSSCWVSSAPRSCGGSRGVRLGPMRIAVTGASGKLGTVVVRELRAAGHDVGMDVVGTRGAGFVQVDFTDYGQTVDALQAVNDQHDGLDAVVHLAAIPAPGIRSDVATFHNNIAVTFNVMWAAIRLGITRIVTASSETVQGLPFDVPPPYLPVDEEYAARPNRSTRS